MSAQYCTSATSTTASRQYVAETTATGTTCTLGRAMLWVGVGAAAAGAAGVTVWDSHRSVRMAQGPQRRSGSGYAWTRERAESYRPNHHRYETKAMKEAKRKAYDASMKLLKSWLSEAEYNYLMEHDELEFPSQYEKDVIYIVKKDPHQKVKIANKHKLSCIHQPLIIETGEACIHIDGAYPAGDRLLANIALLKSDEKEFLKTANITPYTRPTLVMRADRADQERAHNDFTIRWNTNGEPTPLVRYATVTGTSERVYLQG